MMDGSNDMHMPLTRDAESGADIASLIRDATPSEARSWTIGELARECDVTLRALRFYEAKGLLRPRRDGSARLYGDDDRRRLRIIVRAKKIGFSLVQIRELLGLAAAAGPIERRLAEIRVRLVAQTEQLEAMRREAEEALVALSTEVAALDRDLGAP